MEKSNVSKINDLILRGNREFNLGNPKESRKYFEQALLIEPKNIYLLQKLGNIFGKLGNYSSAIICYDKILNQENNLLAIINKGLALHYLKHYDRAINCFDLVLKEKPDNVTTLYNKASSLVKLNKVKEGLDVLKKVIDLDYSYKAKAIFDIDFQEIKTNNEFKKITL